jgi:hypothetical protein
MISVAMNMLVKEVHAMIKKLHDELRRDAKKKHDLIIKKDKALKSIQLAEAEIEITHNLNQIKEILL